MLALRENQFPPATNYATLMGRIAPNWLLAKILLSETPRKY